MSHYHWHRGQSVKSQPASVERRGSRWPFDFSVPVKRDELPDDQRERSQGHRAEGEAREPAVMPSARVKARRRDDITCFALEVHAGKERRELRNPSAA